MFHLEAVSTNNLFTAVQIAVMVLGFYFAYKSLKATQRSVAVAAQNVQTAVSSLELNTNNAQAQLYNHMLMQGRDLQLRQLDLKYKDGWDAEKQSDFLGVVIAYYAACYELRNVLKLPDMVDRLMAADLREAIRIPAFKKKWEEVKPFHSEDFIRYVQSKQGV